MRILALTSVAAVAGAVALSATARVAAERRVIGAADDVPYTTQFENEWVKLVRVRYPANSTVPLHDHPPTVTAYVYLSGSSPVRFTHPKENNRVATRQPTTPGGFRVSRGGNEVHTVENLGPITSEFLRVEFKTDPGPDRSPYHRDNRPLQAGATVASEVRFTNAQMRLTRIALPAGGSTPVTTPAGQPALVLALDGGQERWMAAGQTVQFGNAARTPAEFLRVDFLTPPAK
jgi:hypothetical protein